MTALTRRDVIKGAAGVAMGVGALTSRKSRGEIQDGPGKDLTLEQAIKNPQSFMFSEQASFKIEGDGYSRDLFITSARDSQAKRVQMRVPAGSMRIFRADANVDEFTKQGGMYWQFFGKEGKVQFKQPGALVMIVRDHDDVVRCYSLVFDFRC